MTATTVMQRADAVVETGWPQQSPAGEDANVYVNVCVCETSQQHSPQHHRQQALDHQVQPRPTVVVTVGLLEY